MKRLLLALLAVALLAPASQAATVATTFTGVGTGNTLTLVTGQTGTYVITGTFVATLYLDQSLNGGATWQPLTSFTGTATSTVIPDPGAYRFRCSAFTSGSAVATLATAAVIYQQQRGSNGAIVFQVDDNGVSSTAFSGSGGGGTTGTFADVIVTDTAATSITTAGGISGTPATGTNTAGSNLVIQAATGTGSGAGGSLVFKTAPAGSSGTTPGTETTALTINSAAAAAFVGTVSGTQLTSTIATGTAPLVVASTTNVANLNASSLGGATFAAPGAIGSSTPASGAFTTLAASGAITSTLATGTAPFTVASTTNVGNLNASSLNGATFAAPGAIGGGTPSTGAFTTMTASTATPSTSISTGTIQNSGGYAASRASFFRGLSASADANAVLVNFFSNQSGDPAAYRTAVAVTNNNGGASAGNTGVTAAFTGSIGNSVAGITLSDARVFEANLDTSNATATNTAAYGFYMKNGTNTGTTTTKNGYYCEALTGSTVYAFRSAGAGLVSFGDTTEASAIGTASTVVTGGLSVAKRSYLGTIGSTFKGSVLAGVQDGTADTTGAVGEVVQGTNQTTYANFTSTNTLQQLAVLTSLPPGRYRLDATVTYFGNGATNASISDAQFAISTTTASTAGAVEGRSIAYITEPVTSSTHLTVSFSTDVNISTATSEFLNGKATFTAGNPQYVCSLTAYRLR